MKLIALLEDLEHYIESSRRIPMSNKLIVDGDQVLDFVDQIREALPDELEEAQRLYRDRERVMKDAQREAELLVDETRLQMTQMINNHDLCQEAKEVAEQIVGEARELAREIREGSNEYADNVLKGIEEVMEQAMGSLKNTVGTIRRGREELRRSREVRPE
ncbi:MAG: ATP synthase F0 subunit B [Syntrophomonadaceae bacterium]|nr:ATP synthase F0 subunit B [Syntrophomonadaceae bacterium]